MTRHPESRNERSLNEFLAMGIILLEQINDFLELERLRVACFSARRGGCFCLTIMFV